MWAKATKRRKVRKLKASVAAPAIVTEDRQVSTRQTLLSMTDTLAKESTGMLDYRSAAEFLGLPVGTLYALVHARRIPHVRYATRLVRFEREALVAWQEAHRVLPGTRPEGDGTMPENPGWADGS